MAAGIGIFGGKSRGRKFQDVSLFRCHVLLISAFLFIVVGIVYRLWIHHGEYQFSGKGGQCGHNQHEEEWTSVRGFLSMSCPEFPELFCYVLFTRRPDVLCVPYDRPIDAFSSYSASSLPQPPSTCRLDGLWQVKDWRAAMFRCCCTEKEEAFDSLAVETWHCSL